ncbi:hypothetical protein M0812_15976 [Anaeramoeba flamelloides]|uniref:Serpentine receptor class gamma n=1 Tax=Anaeramoeba flamelloides TaxID=1746091 RepID=A0AAV7ZDY2_9EUKA|nr:hypothetical protein M0812_15976 [Anaeramoeba flamelloides]
MSSNEVLDECEEMISRVFVAIYILGVLFSFYVLYRGYKKYTITKKFGLWNVCSIFLVIGSFTRTVFHFVKIISDNDAYDVFPGFLGSTFILFSCLYLVYFGILTTTVLFMNIKDFTHKHKFRINKKTLKSIFFVFNVLFAVVIIFGCSYLTVLYKRDSDPETIETLILYINLFLVFTGVFWSILGTYYCGKFYKYLLDLPKRNNTEMMKRLSKRIQRTCIYCLATLLLSIFFAIPGLALDNGGVICVHKISNEFAQMSFFLMNFCLLTTFNFISDAQIKKDKESTDKEMDDMEETRTSTSSSD